ncbi:hypothetical protein FB45DRAFT_866500 [Roridomyces roridus]|uniref:Uncharacterized protein n=1 Tax=Roridomyces roridus TaxID=1738132 RepID=A0AAD7BXD7_9AGAR|nr:hypothetical protein FB45DRAFT_866500 [Roridomyces roridus]
MSQPGSSGQGPSYTQPALPVQQAAGAATLPNNSNDRKGKRKRQPEAEVDDPEPAAKRKLSYAYCPTCFERFPGFQTRNEHYGTEACVALAKERSLRVPETFEDLRTSLFENLEMNWGLFNSHGKPVTIRSRQVAAAPARSKQGHAQAPSMSTPQPQPLSHQQPQPQNPIQVSQSTSFLQPAPATPNQLPPRAQSCSSSGGLDTTPRRSHRPPQRQRGMDANNPTYSKVWREQLQGLPVCQALATALTRDARGLPVTNTKSASRRNDLQTPTPGIRPAPPIRWSNYIVGDGRPERMRSTTSGSAQRVDLHMHAVAPPPPVVHVNAQELPNWPANDAVDFQFESFEFIQVEQSKWDTDNGPGGDDAFPGPENLGVETGNVDAGGAAQTAEIDDSIFPPDEEDPDVDAEGEIDEETDAIFPPDEEEEEDCTTPTAGNTGFDGFAGNYHWSDGSPTHGESKSKRKAVW